MSRSPADGASGQPPHPPTANASRPPARRGPSGAWNRRKPAAAAAATDPLDVYGLPSKGETRLHEFKAQEAYYGAIVARYMKYCAGAGGGEELERAFAALGVREAALPASGPEDAAGPPTGRPALPPRQPSATERPDDMPKVLLAMRKLREGILGARRRDRFAQRAYMFIIHASILTRHWESYQPALLYLLHEIHPRTPLAVPELHEFVGYRVLDLACRQDELGDALAVRRAFRHRDRRVGAVVAALVHDDWVRFWRTKRAVDGYQRAIMESAVERVRLHALKCLGRSYMNADRAFVESSSDARWDDLVKNGVGWQLQDNGNVLIRKPKSK